MSVFALVPLLLATSATAVLFASAWHRGPVVFCVAFRYRVCP
eukprot:COSAG03_NODE_11484_length_590_cov_0.837067_1_plen_41_part_10